MNAYQFFVGILMVQLFYGFGITVLSYSLNDMDSTYSTYFTNYEDIAPNLQNVTNKVEEAMQQQLKIPVIDLGALVFYSGNLIVDLMLNFFFAIPSIFSLIINGILNLFPIDSFVATYFKLFITSAISIFYFLSLLVFLTNVRSRGGIV